MVRYAAGSDTDAEPRFVREACIQGQLEHPSIVPVYDLGIAAPDAVGPLNNGRRVNDRGTSEKNLRNRHKQRGFIDSREQLVQINAHVVRSRHDFDTGAEPALLVVEVLDRRKLQLHHDNFVARAAKVKARKNHGLGERHILVERNLARARSDERRDLVAHAYGHLPPALLPCANSAFRPGIRIRAQPLVHATRHRAQRIADHVSSAIQDRKFPAPLQKFIHRATLHSPIFGSGSFSTQGSTALGRPAREVRPEGLHESGEPTR